MWIFLKIKKAKKKPKGKKPFWIIIPLIFTILYLLFSFYYSTKIPPNTFLGSENLSGKDRSEVVRFIREKLNTFENAPVVFMVDDQKISCDLSALGIKFDSNATIEKVLDENHSKNLKDNLLKKFNIPFAKDRRVKPVYQLNTSKLVAFWDASFSKFETKASDATIVFKAGKPEIKQAQSGKVIDRSAAISTLRQRFDYLSDVPIPLVTIDQYPDIKAEQAIRAFEKIRVLNNQRIVLMFLGDSWKLSGSELLDVLKFYSYGLEKGYVAKFEFFQEPLVVKSVRLIDSPASFLDVGINEEKIDSFIEKIAEQIDRPTVNAGLKFENGKIVEFTAARDGQNLDKAKTKELILHKLSVENVSGENEIKILLPVSVTVAKIANEEINSLGIRELIGKGVSYFSGSIANRIHNIKLGASRINGILVNPGEVFSFNSAVGEVSAATGYKQAYVISAGRTILDDGGGICQVSTTVFRAALNAGLPIVARTAHAYRVAYYEQRGFKPGLDATVWSPSVDLSFKNDTPYHLLVQTVIQPATAKLQVDIYGTSDGRKVEISDPIVTNQKPPLPDKYQDEPTLPKGTTKQVDFAAWGATAVFGRKVYRGNEQIIEDTFKSNYRPWQAVYLVGTGG